MGMYDEITGVHVKCPNCGKDVSDFQSKDGACMLDRIDFRHVNRFYTSCDNCKTWIEYNIKTKKMDERTLDDYELIAEFH